MASAYAPPRACSAPSTGASSSTSPTPRSGRRWGSRQVALTVVTRKPLYNPHAGFGVHAYEHQAHCRHWRGSRFAPTSCSPSELSEMAISRRQLRSSRTSTCTADGVLARYEAHAPHKKEEALPPVVEGSTGTAARQAVRFTAALTTTAQNCPISESRWGSYVALRIYCSQSSKIVSKLPP